ncbi:MAG: hypothetical protein KAR87_02975 [Candidatus Aenigmarchaeota archaeon]|nr:hypothetical protein [Candidatus Aenigmarchaeota archaeon]MCK5176485.1 hypothetical protein [Candidatus Aenigmarchaeota archaeon]
MKHKKAQFFIVTAVVLVLIFSGLFARLNDMKVSIPKQDTTLINSYLSYTNSYNNAIKDALDAKNANANLEQVTKYQQDLFFKKNYNLKYAGEFGFFDGFRNEPDITTAGATATRVDNALEMKFNADEETVTLTYNSNLDANIYNRLDIMIKTNHSIDMVIMPLGSGTIIAQKTEGFTFYTIKTTLSGTINPIVFTFISSAPTKATVEYMGIRTQRVMELSSKGYSMKRED